MRTISKQEFVDAIVSMMTINDYQNDKNKVYKKYHADGFLIEPDNNEIILKLLRIVLPDDSYYMILEDFCLINNYGRGKNNNVLTDINGQKIIISSPEELYNYIFGGDDVSANME